MILSSEGKPFKAKWRAEKAIEDMPGFEVIEVEGGFAGTEAVPIAEVNAVNEAVTQGTDVICPGCGQCYHETTPEYDPDRYANPSMLQLKEPWKGYGWDDIGNDPTMGYGCLVCPDCGTSLAPSGKLTVV